MGLIEFCKRKVGAGAGVGTAALLSLLLLMSGCASLSEADAYYVAKTPDIFEPKAKDEPVPLLAEDPPDKFQVIGSMDWEAPRRWSFVRRALERTARLRGADAIILREKDSFQETNLVDVPPTMRWVPVTRIVYVTTGPRNNRSTRAVPVTNFMPVFQSGYVAENVQNWTGVRADFIVWAGTKPVSRVPAIDLEALDP